MIFPTDEADALAARAARIDGFNGVCTCCAEALCVDPCTLTTVLAWWPCTWRSTSASAKLGIRSTNSSSEKWRCVADPRRIDPRNGERDSAAHATRAQSVGGSKVRTRSEGTAAATYTEARRIDRPVWRRSMRVAMRMTVKIFAMAHSRMTTRLVWPNKCE
eukprot:218952-Pleurochrysis_carterae.AAC.2